MHSSVDRKPTISMRLPRALLEEIDDLVRRTRMRSRTEFVERAVETYVDELREARIVVLSGCTFGAIPPAVTSTNRFAAHDEGHRPALIRLLTGGARNP